MNKSFLTEQDVRLKKVDMMRELGINPYPATSFYTNSTAAKIISTYEKSPDSCKGLIIAGRLMSRRIMGKVSFGELQDHTGKIQLYLKRDVLCPGEDKQLYDVVFKKLLDIGDIIGIKGSAFTTKMGTLAIQVETLHVLTKAVNPLPVVKEVTAEGAHKFFYTFSNKEHRYRQRYLDLLLNPEVRDIFAKRAQIMRAMRTYFDSHGFLEVETPILQPIYGGALARPFTTHHNTLDIPLFLRISNELYLKRLIVGGYPGVYEFAKDFRNEGMSRFHNPEFTMLELYVAYRDYYWGMEQTELLFQRIVKEIHETEQVRVGANVIDFGRPWARFTLLEVVKKFSGIDVANLDTQTLRNEAKRVGIYLDATVSRAKIIDAIFSSLCEPKLIQPTFITDYPIEMSPLAKQHRDDATLVERFELICNGKEICNAYSELNDPVEQRNRFEEQLKMRKLGDQEAMVLDEDFLQALGYGMPPTLGIGIGMDRLAMIMANASSIQEVIFFPQMRPTGSHL